MFANRIASSLRRQDWGTFAVEFVLVIAGVLIALQVDRWNEQRIRRAEEANLMVAVREDLRQDHIDLENTRRALTLVHEFGLSSAELLDAGNCGGDCWTALVAFFHASQWVDTALNSSTYDEIKRAGYPKDTQLRSDLTRYYALGDQQARIIEDLPAYRERVRSIIPPKVQDHLWEKCFRIDGRSQYFTADCEPPPDSVDIESIVRDIIAHPDIRPSLSYWLSTISAVLSTLDDQFGGAEQMAERVSGYIDELTR